jgi:polysaccharide export outer membrane protein
MRKPLISLLFACTLITASYSLTDSELQQAVQLYRNSPGQMSAQQSAAYQLQTNSSPLPEVTEEASVIEKAIGRGDLKQFGYKIFRSAAATFSPAGDVPVGPDYTVGPGDSFNITLWGVAEGVFKADVDREGNIILPKVGVVHVAGLSYGDLKPVIEQELSKYYEKINVGISLADLRTIRVFIVGEVVRPGSYSVSSLSTLFNALFAAGGPGKNGSLRNIALIRNGQTIAKVDLYQFLLAGDKKQDAPLQSGDTIFVPVIGPVAGITGNVYRPAIYEIKGNSDLADLIDLSGGVMPTGYLNRVQIERLSDHEKKVVLDKSIALEGKGKLGIPLKNLDSVAIFDVYAAIRNSVNLEGAVKYPGRYELKANMTVKELVPSSAALSYNAYLPKAEIIRMDKLTLHTSVIPFSLEKLFAGDESQNRKLEPDDRIVISTEMRETEKVSLKGEVKLPGDYYIEKGERLSSLLERAGGYSGSAYLFGAVFTRATAKTVQEKGVSRMITDLEQAVAQKEAEMTALSSDAMVAKKAELDKSKELLDRIKAQAVEGRVVVLLDDPEKMKGTSADIELEGGDTLYIPPIPKIVNVVGQVYSPSSLVYEQDKKVSDYINRLGGFTKNADKDSTYVLKADGSVISRDRGFNVMASKLSPGDTIIVPQTIETFNFYANVIEFTKWFYNAAVAYAVISTALK